MARSKKPQRRTASAHPAGARDGLPTKDEILAFVQHARETVGKREIARAFAIKGADRIALKQLLSEMADDGLLTGNRKSIKEKGHLPPVAVYDITGRDGDGDLIAEPAVWDSDDGPRPKAVVKPPRRDDRHSVGIGDRVLARSERLKHAGAYRYSIEPLKRLPKEKTRALGIFRTRKSGGGVIEPIDRKLLKSWTVDQNRAGEAADGDLVRFDLVRIGRSGMTEARVVDVLGNPSDQRQISLIAVHAHGIPDEFPPRVLDELKGLPRVTDAGRVDLRDIPLLTIDPADARDHDDAVHAQSDPDAANPGGWIITVAIADVALYVQPGSALDREARLRGNSVYFPDRVVPMLPEKISNDLCSLRELEDRPCLAVRMVFDAQGHKRRHTFHRALMRSAAKLSYQEAQAAIDGRPSAKAQALLESALKPLWAAYHALCLSRDYRAPLDLDLPERKIVLDAQGRVANVVVPERLPAHRLIEEMMIQANVAAAETLEEKTSPLIYRVHEPPSKEKLLALKDFLATVEMSLPAGTMKSGHFNRILAEARSTPYADLINEVVLRSQSQAVYAPINAGHFGLNLRRYAHFTSPIRRYADLIVHRALVRALALGPGGISDNDLASLDDTAKAISDAERRAMLAERETTDRLIAAHLADRIGAEFNGRIAGVTRSGLFVKLKDTGADGFIPISSLGAEYFQHREDAHALVGDRTGTAFRLGDDVRVRLVEAIPAAGALRFEMLSEGRPAAIGAQKGPRSQRRMSGRKPAYRGRR